ncbi:phage tail assembly protein [Comamonas piscis]|uniref:Phage tail assembly protein n=1 Tax=Comamonas piscis TaxID=1562974 RepID=A0A7G5ELZ0_9BURK|nr:phage tail assembly protein [Comamonas piscis]QMV75015.1 phage tail assembly protein [Comamonas piscis]WSO33495.1 phage tail assembly protein [Comamonas piscis]
MQTAEQITAGAAPDPSQVNPVELNTVTLQQPIKRGDTTITKVQLRVPLGGALRGIVLPELMHMQADAIMLVLPRITTPTLVKQEVENMHPADLVACGAMITRFLVPDSVMESLQQ